MARLFHSWLQTGNVSHVSLSCLVLQCVVVDEFRCLVLHVVEAHFHVTIWLDERSNFPMFVLNLKPLTKEIMNVVKYQMHEKLQQCRSRMHTEEKSQHEPLYLHWRLAGFNFFFIYKNYYIQSYKFPFRRVVSTKDVILEQKKVNANRVFYFFSFCANKKIWLLLACGE